MTEPGSRISYEFSKFRLDLQQRLLLSGSDGEPIPLSPKLFDTLLYFVERRGELLDKGTLMRAIWPNVIVEENNLNQNISALRRVLGESPGEHRFIVTEPGRGYRFVADVRTVTKAPDVTTRAKPPVPPASPTSAGARSDEPQRSIAVLPFVNLTRDIEKEYFGDGLAEELLHALARVPGLRVPARTSSFAYKGRNTDVRQIARDLEVNTLLEGSVRSAGELIRVTVQLIDGRNGYHVWSQSYERRFEDLFKLQDELTAAIVRALDVADPGPTMTQLHQQPPSTDVEAYHLYLQSGALLVRQNRDDFPRIRTMLEEAARRDPQFARAFARMGTLHFISALLGFSGAASLADAERNALHALSLDPGAWEAKGVLAQVNAQRGRWLDAALYFEAAIAANSGEAGTHSGYGLFLGTSGHVRNSACARRARTSGPLIGLVLDSRVGCGGSAFGQSRHCARLSHENNPLADRSLQCRAARGKSCQRREVPDRHTVHQGARRWRCRRYRTGLRGGGRSHKEKDCDRCAARVERPGR
jgi:TolB-like protein